MADDFGWLVYWRRGVFHWRAFGPRGERKGTAETRETAEEAARAEAARLRSALERLDGKVHPGWRQAVITQALRSPGEPSPAQSPQGEDHGRTCPECGPLGEWNACPHDVQGEDHEAGIEALNARQDAVQALLGVLNDIGGGNPWNFNVITEAAEDAWDAAIAAYLSRVSPSRDGTVAVEDVVRRIVARIRKGAPCDSDAPHLRAAAIADAIEREFTRPATGEQTDHGGNQ